MSNIRNTYEDMAKNYLLEARSCLDSRAYRMAIVAAATSAHSAGYFILLIQGIYRQDEKMKSLYEVTEELKKKSAYSGVAANIEWLMNARNAVAHPEEWFVPETTRGASGLSTLKLSEKIKNLPETKRKVFTASIINNLASLHNLANESLKKTEDVLTSFGIPFFSTDVDGLKREIEKRIFKMTQNKIDLEDIHRGKI